MTARKTLGLFLLFLVPMLALFIWRVTLLDNWMLLPRFNPAGTPLKPITSLILLVPPGSYLFLYALLTGSIALFKKGEEKDFRPWRARNAFMLMGMGLIMLMAQAHIIQRSFGGPEPFDHLLFGRFVITLSGLFAVAASNRAPKLPLLESRFRTLGLGPAQRARLMRFSSYVGVVTGLAVIAAGLLLPMNLLVKTLVGISIAQVLLVVIWALVMRRQSRLTASQ